MNGRGLRSGCSAVLPRCRRLAEHRVRAPAALVAEGGALRLSVAASPSPRGDRNPDCERVPDASGMQRLLRSATAPPHGSGSGGLGLEAGAAGGRGPRWTRVRTWSARRTWGRRHCSARAGEGAIWVRNPGWHRQLAACGERRHRCARVDVGTREWKMEAPTGFEPVMGALQAPALPLGDGAPERVIRADRTEDTPGSPAVKGPEERWVARVPVRSAGLHPCPSRPEASRRRPYSTPLRCDINGLVD